MFEELKIDRCVRVEEMGEKGVGGEWGRWLRVRLW